MTYKHIYYLAEIQPGTVIGIDPTNVTQVSEVRQVALFTLKEAVQIFREYDITKRSLLIQVHRIITEQRERKLQQEGPVYITKIHHDSS